MKEIAQEPADNMHRGNVSGNICHLGEPPFVPHFGSVQGGHKRVKLNTAPNVMGEYIADTVAGYGDMSEANARYDAPELESELDGGALGQATSAYLLQSQEEDEDLFSTNV